MSSTKICKLSEVITIQNGYAFASKKFTAEEGMPLIRIRDLKNGITTQTKYSGDYDEAYLVKSGDLLIGMDGEFKCYEWKGSPALLNQRVCRIQNINETFDLKYLYYGINSYLKAIEDVTGFTTVKHLSSSTILNIEFPIPSLEKQRDIVKKLDSAFAEIDLLERNLGVGEEKANQLLQSILSSTFKQSAAFSEQNESSTEENLPIKLIKLVDLCKLVGGGTPSKANAEYYSGNIPWATIRDMRSRWLEDTEHKINEIAVRESSTNVIPSGNVVLASRVGLGKVIQLKHDTAINQDLRALIPKENSKIDSDYLYYWALSITPEIISAGKGATVQGVTLPFLENLVVPLPSLENQSEVVEKLDSAFTEIDLLKMQIRKEKDYAFALRQSLLSSAFSLEEEVA